MNKRIVYRNESGGVSVIIPIDSGLTIEEIAKKDVPKGIAYLIVEASTIPVDRVNRAFWDADFSLPQGLGADYGAGSVWGVVAYSNGIPSRLRNSVTGEEKGI